MTEPNKSHDIRIGQILIEQGVLNDQQVFEIVQAQKRSGVPFGVLAERMFDVTIDSIEQAWVEQYSRFTGVVDLESLEFDAKALREINRRQAHQFEMLPVRFETSGELLIAASRHRLARAVTFAATRLDHQVYFRVAESDQLKQFLVKHYPMSQVTDAILERAADIMRAG